MKNFISKTTEKSIKNKDNSAPFQPARVTAVQRDQCLLETSQGERTGQVTGKFRHQLKHRSEYPVVGDWVLAEIVDSELALIHEIQSRKTFLSRKQAGQEVEEQVLAANVDILFVVSAFDQDFNVRRLERYAVMARQAGIEPVILINKKDLALPNDNRIQLAEEIGGVVAVHGVSAHSGDGLESINYYLTEGHLGIFLGSSGVGKSSLLNKLLGQSVQSTQPIRFSDGKGRHTTTARQMFKLPGGGLIIDTPGLREIQLWADESAVKDVFADISELATQCHFKDCQHQSEPQCAVLKALKEGDLTKARYRSYLKLQKELAYLERKKDPEQQANTKKRWKKINKEMRGYIERKRKYN